MAVTVPDEKIVNVPEISIEAEGSITNEKLNEAIVKSGLDEIKLKTDLEKDEVDKIIKLSSFIAGGSGARGTPSIFVNEFFYPGYISQARIKGLLDQ